MRAGDWVDQPSAGSAAAASSAGASPSVGRRRGGGALLLDPEGVDGARRLRQRGVEEVGGPGERRLHRAGQLGQQHLAGLEVRQAAHLVGRQRTAVEHAALDDQRRVGAGEVPQALGGLDGVARHERDGRGARERGLVEGRHPRVPGRDRGQGVLDHGVRRVPADAAPQLGQLRHGQAAVLRQDGGARAAEPVRQLGDRRGLVGSGHGPPSWFLVPGGRGGRRSNGPGHDERPGAGRTGREEAAPAGAVVPTAPGRPLGRRTRTPTACPLHTCAGRPLTRGLRPPSRVVTGGLWLWTSVRDGAWGLQITCRRPGGPGRSRPPGPGGRGSLGPASTGSAGDGTRSPGRAKGPRRRTGRALRGEAGGRATPRPSPPRGCGSCSRRRGRRGPSSS